MGIAAGILLACLLLQEGRTPAQAPPVQEPAKEVVFFEREHDLADFLESLSALLQVRIEFSRSDVTGTVTVSGSTAPKSLLEQAHRALAAKGLTTVQPPGSPSLVVVKLADAPSLARLEEGPRVGTLAGFAKVFFEVARAKPEDAAAAAQLVLSKTGTATAIKDGRGVVLSDMSPHVEQALRLLDSLQRDFSDPQVVEVPILRTSPTALATLVERVNQARKAVAGGDRVRGSLLANPEGRSVLVVAPAIELDVWRDLVQRFDRAEPAETRHYSPRRFPLKDTARLVEDLVKGSIAPDTGEPWKLVIDGLTGSLVVTATPARHAQVEKLFERLESTATSARSPLRSFPIRHRSAVDMKDMLEGFLSKGALKSAPAPKEPASTAPPTVAPAVEQGPTGPIRPAQSSLPSPMDEEGELVLAVDEATNRLLALGPPRMLEQIEALLLELDVREPQVLIEAMVVSMTESDTREFGAELAVLDADGSTKARLASLFGLGLPAPDAVNLPQFSGLGGSGVVLDPGDYSALVRALQTLQRGRTLTVPKVLVDNHQVAVLNSVLQTPFASTNASTTVATTSFGGTQDAGTQIEITPHISAGDELVLEASVSISSFVGASPNPALPPPRQENKLKSQVTLPDGFTIALGGLEVASDSQGRSQVPGLGDLPLIGWLFGNRTKSESRTRFWIFVRASVQRADGFEGLKYVSGRELEAAGLDDGFPRLEPRVMR